MMKQKIVVLIAFFFLTNSVVYSQSVTFTINIKNRVQTIDNIGASGAWFSEGIGKYWPADKKERMAQLLFSKAFDKAGNPLGIGLSAWRFNIGGGTAEQGDSSGISNPIKRVECFLSPNGTYDWNKQQGYLWFVKKAASYGVENLIAFSNTPPVQFTKNGLGFKTEKNFESNLREDKYKDYADFLATVIRHFNQEGIHFNYVSPVNEPQWDWSNKFGHMSQEGSPWGNKDIYKLTRCLDSTLQANKLSTKIIVAEAGILTALYEGNGKATKQIQHFYSKNSPYYIGNLNHVEHIIEGHSYFTDSGDSDMVKVRKRLRDTAFKYQVPFWQSEYSMLGNGYKEGAKGKISAIDCALFLSKMIYHDLAVANATAWHLWNSWEPSNADFDTRYCLLALKINAANTEGDFTITKNLWALGHYSRFIRPGMQRIVIERSDGLNDIQAAQNIMLSAFTDQQKIVVVAVNYTQASKELNLEIPGVKKVKSIRQYVTTAKADDNMKPYVLSSIKKVVLQPRSIVTIVVEH
ncbi:glycoside hydrolase [Mucilaginibacter arboris]|uniref:Beta-glycosidase n=1 Tax=Mucilaginibacter arboris TaxID=2682090 RepID=A0A7K1SZS3_9SPHI|nr:glycoside hydrolase [Mucilaginibacter arboris]MVN22550.1 beta-glycosidase [Mucilaginibacter arboris]